MNAVRSQSLERLDYVDALRAVALLVVLLVHATFRFSYNSWVSPSNEWEQFLLDNVLLFLNGKARLLFAFLFGLSFSLQMLRAEQKGVDARSRYARRLLLLFQFGALNLLFYQFDVLISFAMCGFVLLALWLFSWKYMGICLLLAGVMLLPDMTTSSSFSRSALQEWSWLQLALFNLQGSCAYHCSLLPITEGSMKMFLLMFVAGMLFGRFRLMDTYLGYLPYLGLIGVASALLLLNGFHLPENRFPMLVFNVLTVICFFLYFLSRQYLHPLVKFLSPLGRCSLTVYVSQGAVMGFVLYGWGLGLAEQLTYSQILACAGGLYLIQLIACHLWLRLFSYGPLEWLWRIASR